jgi:hypothetical protein
MATALSRNVLGEAVPSASARRLAAYARAAVRQLDEAPLAAFEQGTLSFPDPESIPLAEVRA